MERFPLPETLRPEGASIWVILAAVLSVFLLAAVFYYVCDFLAGKIIPDSKKIKQTKKNIMSKQV